MKTWQAILFGIFAGLLSSAVILLIAMPPKGTAVELLPAATAEPIVVHIAGAVNQPGVYYLPRESRLTDAVDRAGGLQPNADAEALNLAARLMDGDKIVVPFAGQTVADVIQRSNASLNSSAAISADDLEVFPIALNTATQEELLHLPGIGPSKAADILAYRQENGPFQRLEDIMKVPGIGDSTFDQIREFIIVSETP
ncbi:MAG: hypothetical protein GYA59_14795 [Chloroflexi bacterium]|nr:hypothetical protein [Chloroflexota bacterium]